MKTPWLLYLLNLSIIVLLSSCGNDDDVSYTPLEEENQIEVIIPQDFTPFNTLSSYNFFVEDIKELKANTPLIPYKPISSLFTNYAKKKRYIYVPEGQKVTYNGDGEPLEFPVGSVVIKNFFYDNVVPTNTRFILETRLMFKTNDGWTFAEYFWNDEQTEAFLDINGDGGFKEISWVQNGETRFLNYRMPSGSECFTCHKAAGENSLIGIKPQSLNSDYTYTDETKNQLQKWIDLGVLINNLPENIVTVVDYNDTSQSLDMRVRSYVDINCASCHSEGGHCDYRPVRFAFNENELLSNRGVCVTPDNQFLDLSEDQKIVKPGDPENSVLFKRISSIEENKRMPLLGRNSRHDEGIALIEAWILSLAESCN